MLSVLFSQSLYAGLLVGIAIFGEIVLIPAIYLGYIGRINLWAVLVIALAAILLADGTWYAIGRLFPNKRALQNRFLRKRVEQAKPFQLFFQKYQTRALFYSKFLYGTRIIFQILAGLQGMPVRRYFIINLSSSLLWLFIVTSLGIILGAKLQSFENALYGTQVAATVSVVVIIILYFVIPWILRYFMESSSQDS